MKYNYELYVANVHTHTHTHHHIIFSTINNFYQMYNNYVYHDMNLLQSDPSSLYIPKRLNYCKNSTVIQKLVYVTNQ